MKTIYIKGQVFGPGSGDKGENIAQVDADGTVRVFCPVEQIMTTCHGLTQDQHQQIRDARPYSTITITE
jgi:hypothetical protein